MLAFSQAHVGIYMGANFMGVNMQSPDLSSQTQAGYQAGAYFRAGKILYGQAGLEYQHSRVDFTFSDTADAAMTGPVKLNMIKLPLYAGVNLLPMTDRVVNVRVYAGPTLGYIFNVPLNDVDLQLSDFKQVRIDGTVGAGLDILLFSVDVGYNFGVNQLFTDEFDGKTHYAFVNAGLKF